MKTKFSRRQFIGIAAGTAGIVATAGPIFQMTKSKLTTKVRPSKPNILCIVADDVGALDLNYYNPKVRFDCPNITKLAEEGMVFNYAYSATPVCSPTRTALILGQYPQRYAIGNGGPISIRQNLSLPKQPVLPAILRKSGYKTALFGKWHLGCEPKYGPTRNGYDDFYGILRGVVDPFTHTNSGGELDFFEGEIINFQEGYITDLLTDKAVEYVSRDHTKPFFLSLHYTAAHRPLLGPKDRHLSDQFWNSPRSKGRNKEFQSMGKSFSEVVQSMDLGIGKVLNALEQSGKAEDTLVIFTSDNGGVGIGKNGSRGFKMTLFEGGIRVPGIIRWPALFQGGVSSSDPIITMDLTATMLDAAGASTNGLDGVSLLPFLERGSPILERTLFWRYAHYSAARSRRWKYFRFKETEALYEIERDEMEADDLKLENHELFGRFQKEYAQWEAKLLPRIDPYKFPEIYG